MALPMLVNNTDCGPVNPLQGLAKRFDQDTGLQQDHFGAGRAGPSRETFRTPQSAPPALEQEASRFFAHSPHSNFSSPPPTAFDIAALRGALPLSHAASPSPSLHQHAQHAQHAPASWAADFLKQQPRHAAASQASVHGKAEIHQERQSTLQAPGVLNPGPLVAGPQWASQVGPMQYRSQWMPQLAPQAHASPAQSVLWEQEFQSQEASLSSPIISEPQPLLAQPKSESRTLQSANDADDLARTAGLLVETVKDEQNPKFKNSKFLGLMRQLRDGEVVVAGNEMVNADLVGESVDLKGKGRAVAGSLDRRAGLMTADPGAASQMRRVHFNNSEEATAQDNSEVLEEDPNDAYFRQHNDDYINYWNSVAEDRPQEVSPSRAAAQAAEWGALQDAWDKFEVTAAGVKSIANYPFQQHNPYLLGDSSRTHNHAAHLHVSKSFYESVLELEAAVQRDPANARAWFDLGVKQQENEREAKAVLALQRALDLDPTHLPAWLAIAISHTNENNRLAADDAIEEWLMRNDRYFDTTKPFRAERDVRTNNNAIGKHAEMTEVLMAMARSSPNGEIDADVQIALAVLLNTSEDYEKAQDCFRTALAVRPDDWQLYNRVGATLANSGSAEEALQYYYRALELNPAYIRARFNLGISCINMRRYEEAAQHILDALVLQDSDGTVNGPNDDKRGITSSALWESLKTTCLHLQRIDLASLCDRHDLEGLRREFNV